MISSVIPKSPDNRNIRVLQFLDAYERQESLWNPSLDSYKNKAARDDAYMQIIEDLKLPTLTINDVKLKVKSIRTTYKKELRLLNKHREEGRPYTPKLFWFNRADTFLKNVSISRPKISKQDDTSNNDCKSYVIDYLEATNRATLDATSENIVDNIVEEIENNSCEEFQYKDTNSDIDGQSQGNMEILETSTDDNEPLSSICDTKSRNDFPNKYNSNTKSDFNMSINRESHEPHSTVTCSNIGDDEYEIFCRSVAVQLRSIKDNYSRSVAKLKIQQILFEAETGHYRNNPCITIPISQSMSNL